MLITVIDEEVCLAFDQKIDKLKDKLAKTIKIKETYHIEKHDKIVSIDQRQIQRSV